MSQYNKPVIGIAGGIGSGKSTVAGMLADLGCHVVNSDELARRVLRLRDVVDELLAWWGPEILDESGQVDRKRVADIVFRNAAEREKLERLTHPRIEALRRAMFNAAPTDAPALVIDAPLLFEAGVDSECDAIIFVESSETDRAARVQESRGWNEDELKQREQTQWSLDEKRSRADHVVWNTADLSMLRQDVKWVLNDILRSFRVSPAVRH